LIPILLKATTQCSYLPSSLVLVAVISYLYFHAFFYQQRRTRVLHFGILALVGIGNIFFESYTSIIWILSGLIIAGYVFLISKLFVEESQSRGFSYFSNPGSRIAWLRNFVFLSALFFVSLPLPLNLIANCALYFVLIGHVVYQLFQESSFLSPIPIGNKYKKSTLTPEIKASIIDRLDEVMNENHFYRQDDASLGSLANLLGVTNHHLSQVLNESMKISFQDLLARFRIRDACLLLKNEANEQMKIETIANMVGYNSKSSFNTAFKKRTGLTPSEYRMDKNVRTYGEERLSERKTPSYKGERFSLNHVFNLKLNRNMIRVSIRNLRKHRLHSSLNIIGLAIGLSACLTIAAYVHYELSYDKHHANSESVYRIALNRIYPDYNKEWAITAPVLAPTITDILPEVEHYTRISWDHIMLARAGKKMQKQRITAVDSGFFQVFDSKIISGQITNEFFKRQDGIILTQTAAQKYFGREDPIGELFSIQLPMENEKRLVSVEAVISDPLPNSHFSYEVLATFDILQFPEWIFTTWGTWAVYSYIKVHPDTDPYLLRRKINEISEENMAVGNDDFDTWLSAGNAYDYFLQPLTDIHLNSNLTEEFEANSSVTFVYFFALVGIFILLMAVVNFVNLATARASYRTLEVGIRKAVGAGRKDLMMQFLMESTLITVIAMVIALPLTQFFLPYFNQTIGKSISLQPFITPVGVCAFIATPIVLGLLSGFYPALYLSNYGPAAIFQKAVVRRGKEGFRHLLVIGQFVIAVILLSGTITVFRQMHYLTNKPLGFDKDQLIKVDRLPFTGNKIDVFKQEASLISGVHGITTSNFPIDEIRSGSSISTKEKPESWINSSFLTVDENYIPTLGIKLVAGRNFLPTEIESQEGGIEKIILNRAAVKALGWQPEEAVNKVLNESTGINVQIIGVLEDFNFGSLHKPVGPVQLSSSKFEAPFRSATIRLDPRRTKEALASLEELWATLSPDLVFEYQFVDDTMAQYYEAERLTGKLFIIFSGLGIFICCLGLFGLMGYVVEKRTKEVGIRKVMGASISHIILLLSKDYIRLVLISSALAIPIAWWGLSQWLESFAYRVDNSVWTFLSAGLLVTIISWFTVAFYSYQAARTNPVNSLRSE
jgi:AraC-like DNA-binding protein/ABC-type lipoprotein release transport system permease subunit